MWQTGVKSTNLVNVDERAVEESGLSPGCCVGTCREEKPCARPRKLEKRPEEDSGRDVDMDRAVSESCLVEVWLDKG